MESLRDLLVPSPDSLSRFVRGAVATPLYDTLQDFYVLTSVS